MEGPVYQVRLSEGPARRVRGTPFDNPSYFGGHDKRAPPISEGPACQVRRITFDHPSCFPGHDRRAPPGVQPLPNPFRTRGGRKHFPPHAGGRKGGCTFAPLEGRARRVRRTTFDHPWRFSGHDKRALRTLEGPACQVLRATLDNPSGFCGRDKHAPPDGHDRRAPPKG
mgnify:CR=1 FL=1